MARNSFRRDSELGSLMPNLLGNSQRQGESLGTTEIRQYMNAAYNIPSSARRPSVLGIDQMVTPAGKVVSKRLSMAMNKAMNEASPVAGKATAKKFCIRIKKIQQNDSIAPTPAALRESQLDPEELKDALLQQAMAQRRALVTRSLRKGSGRDVKRPKYELNITLPDPPRMRQPDLVSMTSTQQAAAQSPFRFGPAKPLSPMEGVPERLGNAVEARPSTLRMTPDGFKIPNCALSPMEGIPEFSAIPSAPTVPKPQSPSIDAMPPPPPVDMGYDDNQDDFGGMDDYADDYGDGGATWNEPLPGRVSEQVIAPKRKRIVLNPGIRLRNELPRKSLAVDITVGRQEVAPGLRRSTRRAQEPLRWWLGEKKQFDRVRHKTMPTISAVMIADPSSPWKTVDDPIGARQDKYKDPRLEKQHKKNKAAKSRAKAKKPHPRYADVHADEMSDEETVLVGSPQKTNNIVSKELIVAEEAGKRDEDEETLVINNTNRDTPDGKSTAHAAVASVDNSDMTVPLGQHIAATPISKNSMGIILEADGSCGSIDNTDELRDGDEDNEIIIPSNTPQMASKAPPVSETIILPRMSPIEAKEIKSSTPTSVRVADNDSQKGDSAVLPEPSLNHMQESLEKHASIDQHVESAQKVHEGTDSRLDQEEENEENAGVEKVEDEAGNDKENVGVSQQQPTLSLKEESPVKEAPRRSTRNRSQKKV